jgi:hypothetical protein
VVIGVGNEFRRDDGAGPAVVAKLRDLASPGVELVTMDGEPTRLIEAWTGAALASSSTPFALSRRNRGRFIVSWWTGRRLGGPGLRGRRARMASALTTRSAWPWPWTGCQPA